MTTRELMIGNYVMAINNYEDIFYVNCIYGYRDLNITSGIYKNYDTTIRDIKPIPLTEEWLLKFGFDKLKIPTSLKEFYIEYYKKDNFIVYLLKDSFEVELILSSSKEQFNLFKNFKKEVHILQNLYFALTDEELMIKNK